MINDINKLLILASNYEERCFQNWMVTARIRKLPNGQYRVLSEKGKNLGTSKTKEEAVKRLHEVEYFKHKDENANDDQKIDLTKATDFSYSAIMREMRQHATSDQVREFLISFKKEFDKAIKHKKKEPDQIALKKVIDMFDNKYGVKLKITKKASNELGDAAQVGKYLANIVRFTISKIPLEKQPAALQSLKTKFYSMNSNELAAKNLPVMAGIGQSITFVKHVLFNHDAGYIREVLNHLVNNL